MSVLVQAAVKAPPQHGAVQQSLEQVRAHAPVVGRVLATFGEASIGDYLRDALPAVAHSFQPRDDLAAVVEKYSCALLGRDVAESARRSIMESPRALTANHHGIDYFAQSVQGSLILSLLARARGNPEQCAVVFACGSVPLDNFTYPMGMLIYGVQSANWETLPLRVPVFSNRHRRELVSVAGAIDVAMTERAAQRLSTKVQQGEICRSLGETLQSILRDYACPEVLEARDYSQQSVLLNQRLWHRLFAGATPVPKIVVLELEAIVRDLLQADLDDAGSLAWSVHFDSQLRHAVLEQLDGARACWESEALVQRLQTRAREAGAGNTTGAGTFLYWGVTERGRRVPLWIEEHGGSVRLRGVDDKGAELEIPFTAAAIREQLAARQLLPSLFNCFLTLAFARGINCVGAYYQAEYLPAMQAGLIAALRTAGGYGQIADAVASVPTDSYLAGMQTVMRYHDDDALIAAGPAEIIASGGLDNDDLDRILALSVEDAHIASLMETVADLMPEQARSPEWRRHIAEDCARLLANSVVIK